MEKLIKYKVTNNQAGLFDLQFVVQEYFSDSFNRFSFIKLFCDELKEKKIIASNYYYPVLDKYKEFPLYSGNIFFAFIHRILNMHRLLYVVDVYDEKTLQHYVDEIPHESMYMIVDNKENLVLLEYFKKMAGTKEFTLRGLMSKLGERNMDSVNYLLFADDVGNVQLVGREREKELVLKSVQDFFVERGISMEVDD